MTAPTLHDLATAVLTGSARDADIKALAARVLEESAQWRQREHRIRGLEADLVQARARVRELEEVLQLALGDLGASAGIASLDHTERVECGACNGMGFGRPLVVGENDIVEPTCAACGGTGARR